MPVANIAIGPVGLTNTLQILHRHLSVRNLLTLIFVLGLAITLLHKSMLFISDAMSFRQLGYAVAITPALALLMAASVWERLSEHCGMAPVLRRTMIAFAAVVTLAWFASISSIGTSILLVCAVFLGAGLSTLFWALLPQVISALKAKESLTGQAVAGRLPGLANLARTGCGCATDRFGNVDPRCCISNGLRNGRSISADCNIFGRVSVAFQGIGEAVTLFVNDERSEPRSPTA